MEKLIYEAYDLTTDTLVKLTHKHTPQTSWHVSTFSDYISEKSFDDLSNAANYVREEISKFEDDDSPTAEKVIADIAETVSTPDYVVEWYMVDDIPFIVVYDEDED